MGLRHNGGGRHRGEEKKHPKMNHTTPGGPRGKANNVPAPQMYALISTTARRACAYHWADISAGPMGAVQTSSVDSLFFFSWDIFGGR